MGAEIQPAHSFTRGNSARSRTATRAPPARRKRAAVLPAGPPPTTRTSYVSTAGTYPRRPRKRASVDEIFVPVAGRGVVVGSGVAADDLDAVRGADDHGRDVALQLEELLVEVVAEVAAEAIDQG